MQAETNSSVLSNLKETFYPTTQVTCKSGKHDLSLPNARIADGRCRICRRDRQRKYRMTTKGRVADNNYNYTRFKTRLLIRMIMKHNTIKELERQLDGKEISD